jgi:hypothetical protein
MNERNIRAITPLLLFFLGVAVEIYSIDAKVQKDTSNVVIALMSSAASLATAGSNGVKDDNKPSN